MARALALVVILLAAVMVAPLAVAASSTPSSSEAGSAATAPGPSDAADPARLTHKAKARIGLFKLNDPSQQ